MENALEEQYEEEVIDNLEEQEHQDDDNEEEIDSLISGDESPEDVEALARTMGWSPKEEYKGDPELWKDAAGYVEDAEKDFRRMRRVNQVLVRKVEKTEKGIEAMLAHHERELQAAKEKAFQEAMAELEAKHAQAVEDGDVDAAKKVMNERLKLESNPNKANEDALVQSWTEKNSWFKTDPVLADAATKYCDLAAARGESVEQQLEGATKYIEETFPHKFQTRQVRSAPAMVNARGNNTKKPAPKAGSYEALKQEFRHECDQFVKTTGGTKDQWLKYATEEMFI